MNVKAILPARVRRLLRMPKEFLAGVRRSAFKIRHRSEFINIYHCCVHKTASQWLRHLLSDPVVYKNCGLRPFHYQSRLTEGFDGRKLTEREFTEAFPEHTIVSPLYLSYDRFEAIPKPASYRAFFVVRDPRDIVVSWYFSSMYSHGPMGIGSALAHDLKEKATEDAFTEVIKSLANFGLFEAIDSWLVASQSGKAVLVRFEDLTGPNSSQHVQDLLQMLDIRIPSADLDRLMERYAFENLSKGREQGKEDVRSHYRKGIAGDWRNHLDQSSLDLLGRLTDELPARLGYQDSVVHA